MHRSILAAIAAFFITAFAAQAQVVVSSRTGTESGLLGNIILAALQAGGIETVDRLQLGAAPAVRQAILAGEIDLYPEYTGNAAFFFTRADDPVWKDAGAAYDAARKLDYETNGLVWLNPAPADSGWGIAIRDDIAEAEGLKTLGDLGRYIAGGGALKLAVSAGFVNSGAALPAFQTAYGFTLTPDQIVILSGGGTAAAIAAAAAGSGGVNAAMVRRTDGGIAPSGLVVLADDKAAQPVYRPAPVIREAVLRQNPKIRDLLRPVFEKLDVETLRSLNGRVQAGGEPARAVAEDFLRANGFLD